MTKAELIDSVTASGNMPAGMTKKVVLGVFDTIVDEIKESVKTAGKFTIPGFGTFTRKVRSAREGRNPQTGEAITIDPSTTITFKAAKDIKKYMVNGAE